MRRALGPAALLAVLLAASPARALTLALDGDGDADESAPGGPPPAVAVESYAAPAVAAPELQRALHELYSLDYGPAEADAEVFLSSHPDNPYAELFLSGELWWRSATEAQAAPDDPRLAARFEAHTRAAVTKAKRLFKTPPTRVRAEAYFVAGMALGLEGQWRLTNHQWFKAYLDGKKAIKYLRKSLEIDPSLHDANLGLGIFDYQSAVLPGVLKLGALLLVHGDRERGLARIQDAIQNGQFAGQQASSFLLTIYQTQEKDYPRALELAQRLRGQFPDSVYLEGVEGLLRAQLGDAAGAASVWADLYGRLSAEPDALRRKLWAVLCGAYGEGCLSDEHLAAAEGFVDAALAAPSPDPSLAPGWGSALRLVRALSLDARRRIKEARQDYAAVRDDPAAPAAFKGLAAACMEQACTRGRIFSLRQP